MRNYFKNFFLTLLAAFVGNQIGGLFRRELLGQPAQTIKFKFTDEDGETYTNIPVGTKLYPAWAFALVGKPRWLFALLGGLLAGALVDDRYEEMWVKMILSGVKKIEATDI